MISGKKVLTVGTFDFFHPGHRYFLNDAKKLGNKLYVIVARDKTVLAGKGLEPKYSEKERLKKIQISGIPDFVFLGDLKDKFKLVRKIKPDVFALGYDQKAPIEKIRSVIPGIQIVRIKAYYPEKYKSRIMRG